MDGKKANAQNWGLPVCPCVAFQPKCVLTEKALQFLFLSFLTLSLSLETLPCNSRVRTKSVLHNNAWEFLSFLVISRGPFDRGEKCLHCHIVGSANSTKGIEILVDSNGHKIIRILLSDKGTWSCLANFISRLLSFLGRGKKIVKVKNKGMSRRSKLSFRGYVCFFSLSLSQSFVVC